MEKTGVWLRVKVKVKVRHVHLLQTGCLMLEMLELMWAGPLCFIWLVANLRDVSLHVHGDEIKSIHFWSCSKQTSIKTLKKYYTITCLYNIPIL